MGDDLERAIEIATEAREIGWLERKLVAADYDDCPYTDELRRAAWLDGWSKARAGWFSATQKEAPRG